MSAAEGLTLAELASALGGTAEGDPNTRVYGAAGLDDAAPGTLVRVEHERFLRQANESDAAALLVDEKLDPLRKPAVRVPHVRLAFIRCLELFAAEETAPPGVHPTAVVDPSAGIGPGCSVGPAVVIGPRVRLADRVVVHAGAVLMEEAVVGPDSILYPRVVLYPRTLIGARVRIHAGAVIGSDGYGYEWTGEKHLKRPHNGRVRVCDDVEIGANTTIDRATTGETFIGPGAKIDNLVQIGHNVRIGAHCLIVAQVGIAGSVTLGSGVVIAGQGGLKDHVRIGDGAKLIGRPGVWGDVPPGAIVSGYPARPHREAVRIEAALGQLPELLKRVKELERLLEERSLRHEAED